MYLCCQNICTGFYYQCICDSFMWILVRFISYFIHNFTKTEIEALIECEATNQSGESVVM